MATKSKAASKSKATKASKSKASKTTKAAASKSKASGLKSSKSPAAKSSVQRFSALVEKHESSEACAITIPFDVQEVFGARGRVAVRGTINGFPYRNSIFPMGGCHMMPVNRGMREGAGVKGGDTVSFTMERDTEARVVTPPADFARALKANKDAQAAWDKLSYTHKKEYAKSIEEAKRPETRQRRIEKSIEMLAAGKKEPR